MVNLQPTYQKSHVTIDGHLRRSLCGGVNPSIHAALSNRRLGDVWAFFDPLGGPKKVVREPCLSFLGADGAAAAAESEAVAFLFTFIVSRQQFYSSWRVTVHLSRPDQNLLKYLGFALFIS
jgi:hypothetical protein